MKAKADVFNTITSADWARSIAVRRAHKNLASQKIKEATTPMIKSRLLTAILLIASSKMMASDDALFLKAIAMVESSTAKCPGGDDMAVGPCGEIGRYQMMPDTWRMHTSWPLADAKIPLRSAHVAAKHLAWLKKAGYSDDYEILADMWRYGVEGWRFAPVQQRMAYTARVMNLFNEMKDRK